MSRRVARRRLLQAAGCGLLTPATPWAQEFPNRPIRIVVPQAPGGGTDILARNLAVRLTELLKQNTVVENRTGAGSLIGTEFAARAPADGYTLMMGGIFEKEQPPIETDLCDRRHVSKLAIEVDR